MKTSPFAATAAALTLAFGAAAVRAETVTVTLRGSHENINDATGVFGPAGGRITDASFTQTFLINTDVGTFSPPTPTSVSYNSIFEAPGPYAVSGSLGSRLLQSQKARSVARATADRKLAASLS